MYENLSSVGSSPTATTKFNMRKYNSEDTEAVDITINEAEYSFLVSKQGIGVRRKDNKSPSLGEVQMVTRYVFAEGWADKRDYQKKEGGDWMVD
jgi:hypothetical protein